MDHKSGSNQAVPSSVIEGLEISQGSVEGEDPEVRRRHLTIIQTLLENFNMEETEYFYRSSNACEVRVDVSDFSTDCALDISRMRERIIHLTGSDKIRLNDQKYNKKIADQLKKEYEVEMNRLEKERAAKEKLRVHRLIVEGIIRRPEEAEDKPNHKKKNKTNKQHSRKNSTYGSDKPSVCSATSNSYHSRAHSAPSATRRQSSRSYDTQMSHLADTTEEDADSGISGSHDDMREDVAASKKEIRQKLLGKYEDPAVQKLREEETVRGLYTLAEDIVYPRRKSAAS